MKLNKSRSKSNIIFLKGRYDRKILEYIRNTPPADLSELDKRSENIAASILKSESYTDRS